MNEAEIRHLIWRLRNNDTARHLCELAAQALSDSFDQVRKLQDRLEMTWVWEEVDGVMTKVKVEPGSFPDGIECRDQTIRLLEQRVSELESTNTKKPQSEDWGPG